MEALQRENKRETWEEREERSSSEGKEKQTTEGGGRKRKNKRSGIENKRRPLRSRMKKELRGRKNLAAFYGFQFNSQNKNQTKQTCNLPLDLSDKLALITSESCCLERRNWLNAFSASPCTHRAPASVQSLLKTAHGRARGQTVLVSRSRRPKSGRSC